MSRLNSHLQALLLILRQTEAARGQTVAQYYRAEHAYRATPARRHKRDRAESKRRARWMGLCRFYGQPLIGGDYALGL